VLAGITEDGRAVVEEAMVTYANAVREHYLGPLTRPQMSGMGENCRRISAALRTTAPEAKFGRT
jgi:hypothetical protein